MMMFGSCVRRGGSRLGIKTSLLCGASLLALVVISEPALALNLKSMSVVSPAAGAAAAQAAAAQQAAAAAQQAQQSLAAAAAALQALRATQDAARSLALQVGTTVPNGVATGGLMPQGGVTRDAASTATDIKWVVDGTDATLWQGADRTITQTVAGGRTTVGITQTQSKAILNWETFNIGRETTLAFAQQASDWTVLNRVGPSVAPSQILGNITAKGGVYVINRNGIIFDGSSQINVHALVASTLDVGAIGTNRSTRDQYFLNSGITTSPTSFSVFEEGGTAATTVQGDVVVKAGAKITTDIVSLDSPGFVFLFGANVSNAGTISVPAGQVAMVAARQLLVTPGTDEAAVLPTTVLPNGVTFRGAGFTIDKYDTQYGAAGNSGTSVYLAGTGSVTNSGLIETPRGIVTLVGDKIALTQSGVISADTGISRNSMVLMHAVTSIDIDGVISMLPYDDPNTPTLPQGGSGSTVASFAPAYVELAAQSTVTVNSTGLISAPSASVSLAGVKFADTGDGRHLGYLPEGSTSRQTLSPSVSAPQRVLLQPGAVIDVAGLQNVEMPVSYNFVSFEPRSEFADMPLQRNGALYGETLWIDIRASGTRSDGTKWVGTPLADASGVVNAVGKNIYQLMATGGTVSLSTDTATSGAHEVVARSGSVINTAGGSIAYTGGMVYSTRLLGVDGRIYSMANADPNMTYVGIAGQFTKSHDRWGVSETWSALSQHYEPGYTDGANAGGVSITTVYPVLQATLLFGSVAGERQIANAMLPSQGSLSLFTYSTVIIGADASTLPANFDTDYLTKALPQTNPNSAEIAVSDNFKSVSKYQTLLSADVLSSYGLSALTITSNDLVVAKGSTVSLAAGGGFTVKTGGAIDIAGTVQAAGGNISLANYPYTISSAVDSSSVRSVTASGHYDIFVGGTLDVSGRWVNDTGRFGADSGALGYAYIDGGTISIETSIASSNTQGGNDRTGSILLVAGSVLDVSSGGYISPRGEARLASTGVISGKGGEISLLIYQKKTVSQTSIDWIDETGVGPYRPSSLSQSAYIQLDGTLRAYGFETNGTLEIGAPSTIRIGGTLAAGEVSAIRISSIDPSAGTALPISLFTDGGFGAYTIVSTPDDYSGKATGIMVSAGVDLTLQQKNLTSLADYRAVPTGTKISSVASLTTLPTDRRTPVDLTLKADNILIDADATHGAARIVTDPGAAVNLVGYPIYATIDGTPSWIDGRAVNVLILGQIEDHGGTVTINAEKTWLGPRSTIDLSGTFVAHTDFGIPGGPTTSGEYLAGGTLTIEAARRTDLVKTPDSSNAGYEKALSLAGTSVVGQAGAVVDVSGAAGTILVAGSVGTGPSAVDLWSDAGTVKIDTGAFVWAGAFVANADPRANRGTLILGGSSSVDLGQTGAAVKAALAGVATPVSASALTALSSITSLSAYTDRMEVAVDDLTAFDNVYLYAGASRGGAARIFTTLDGGTAIYDYRYPILGTIYIGDNLDWSVANRLNIAARLIVATSLDKTVDISAPYVLLTGGGGARWTTLGTSTNTLTVTAQTLDIEGAALAGFKQVDLVSRGDIRLSTPKVVNGTDATTNLAIDASTFTGRLDLDANLVMQAQRIYPVSAVDFTIQTPGTVTVRAPAGSNTSIPLSAGGSITVLATEITQAGNLFAPLGRITLGNTDTSVSSIVTTKVTLADGSLTSVTLYDTTVPYGATIDGTNWYYNAALSPLGTPPAKGLVLDGGAVVVTEQSTIDVRGGGDLQAMEFIAGKNGSRDVLALAGVYALVPSVNGAVSAFDIHFTTADSASSAGRSTTADKTSIAGDAYPLAGTQITIDGGNGIPAGTYTLYPAHYATLPGALTVTYFGSNLGKGIASGVTLPDGTVLVTGHTTQSTASGKVTSGTDLFAVRTSSVWQQYSEYSFSKATSYFTRKAIHDGTVVPRLPVDAGRLAVTAQQQIVLDGVARTQPADGGRGSELDISAIKLAVVGPGMLASNDSTVQALRADGYVPLDVSQLNGFGFESVLIGGLRHDTATGTRIDAAATNVLVDTRGEAFSAPEILLVAQQGARTLQTVRYYLTGDIDGTAPVDLMVEVPVYASAPGTGTVTIASGSVIDIRGEVHSGSGRYFYFNNPTANASAAAELATYLGGQLAGTTISNASLTQLPLFVRGADALGNPIWVPASDTQSGSAAYTTLATLLNNLYGGSASTAPRPGAIFAATADSTLKIAGPTTDALVVNFARQGAYTIRDTVGLSDNGAGKVSIEAGATVLAPNLTVQAVAHTDAITIAPGTLQTGQVNLAAQTVTIGAGPTASLQVSAGTFSRVEGLSVKALAGVITLGSVFASDTLQRLTLDARTLLGTGADALIETPNGTVTLVNTGAAGKAATNTSAAGTFAIDAAEIVLGGGTQAILGYAAVDWTASKQLRVAASGTLALGFDPDQINTDTGALPSAAPAVNLTVRTPATLVDAATSTGAGGTFALSTKGQASISGRTDTADPTPRGELGGSFALTAAGITLDSLLQAQSGTLALTATSGDVVLGDHAFIAAGGYTKVLIDQSVYVMGGKATLTADAGSVKTAAGSVIDVGQPADGLGFGGELTITSYGSPDLQGNVRGSGGPGLGGYFTLDTHGGLDTTAFNVLADKLLAGGFSGLIDIHTRQGNLELLEGHTLKANGVALTADGLVAGVAGTGETKWSLDPTGATGRIVISGTIDARGYDGTTADGTGQAGGQVALWGGNAVVLTGTDGGRAGGKILASTGHGDERGGDVAIGVAWDAKWDLVNKIGGIDLQPGSVIDVHGGTKGGLSGGTVTLRAPRDGADDVKIQQIKSTITGARSVSVEAYVAFSTNGDGGLTAPGWDGVVDPAGLYRVLSNGQIVLADGTWSSVSGWTLTIGDTYTTAPVVKINGVEQTTVLKVASATLSVTSGGTYTSVPTVYFMVGNTKVAQGTAPVTLSTLSIANGPSGVAAGVPIFNGSTPIGTAIVQSGVLVGVSLTATLTSLPSSLLYYSSGFKTITNGSGGVSFSGTYAVTSGSVTSISALTSYSGTPTISIDSTYAVGTSTAVVAASDVKSGVSVKIASTTGLSSAPTASNVTIDGVTCSTSVCSWSSTNRGSGQIVGGVFVADSFVPATGTFSTTSITPATGKAEFTPSTASTNAHYTFYNDTLVKVVQGRWTNAYGATFGFSGAVSRLLAPLVPTLGEGVVHLTPGIELVNPVSYYNNGDITVVSNWNLAAGTATNLSTNTYTTATETTTTNLTKYVQVDDTADSAKWSAIEFLYRYIADYGTGKKYVEPGALTLRALNDVKINASISDGFFQFGNYYDATYVKDVASYEASTSPPRVIDGGLYQINTFANSYGVPIAPYVAASNVASPTTEALAAADLFPNQLYVCTTAGCGTKQLVTDPGSWSYRITAGAETTSANPSAMRMLSTGTRGDIIVDTHKTISLTYVNTLTKTMATTSVDLPTMIRTGTGDITLRAARDVVLADTAAPGVIYAAGVNTAKLADPGYTLVNGSVVATNPDGFYEPVLLGYGGTATTLTIAELYGPANAAAFPHKGGDVDIEAKRDVVGYLASASIGTADYQYYEPWLLALSKFSAATSLDGSYTGAGVFAPTGTTIASQSAWWIQYGSFQQGILSAGGNVRLVAGRDIDDVSVSLPTTGRVSGGLVATSSGTLNTPVLHLYDSGNMTVRSGGDILGGAYYEGSGHASIVARGSIGAYGTIKKAAASSLTLPNVPVLAVDTGQLSMTAGGALTVASPINPAELHQQAQQQGSGNNAYTVAYMDTYGPDSLVSLTAVAGDLTIRVAPTSIGLSGSINAAVSTASAYPASFAATAVSGDIVTTGLVASNLTDKFTYGMTGIVLSGSEHGTLQLLAEGSVDLTFGYVNGTYTGVNNTSRSIPPYISAGPSLLDAAFDAFRPNAWYGTKDDSTYAGEALSRLVLAHADDNAVARIYAATGDIVAAAGIKLVSASDSSIAGLIRVEINQPARIQAGRDIVDLNLIVQNTDDSDISSVIAGRDLYYTGYNNAGGLQVAGPGFFLVEAGRDLGPFVNPALNTPSNVLVQQGIAAVGTASETPVGNIYIARSSVGLYNAALTGPYYSTGKKIVTDYNVNKRRNPLLSDTSADIVTLFGVANGIDTAAMAAAYLDPANAGNVAYTYTSEFEAFLARLNVTRDPTKSLVETFESLTPDQQTVFASQILFAELKAVGVAQSVESTKGQYQRGYEAINTLFPASLGYTANDLSGGSNGANALVSTGNLDLRHATIQTRYGGDISILGPGGDIIVGSLATEPNSNLALRDLGVMTFAGGAINTFTDGSVLVNSSRVLTTQGGDILMWTSNGNLDAGRGAKTTLSLPALQVEYDQDAYQSVDLGGLVTGAGIGVLKTSRFARTSDVYLLAPRGVVDAGTAGIRVSGDIVVAAMTVLNAANIKVGGTSVGIPTVVAPNIAGLTGASNAAGAAAKQAEAPTGTGGRGDQASIFVVEVVGYGGGDGGTGATGATPGTGTGASGEKQGGEKQGGE